MKKPRGLSFAQLFIIAIVLAVSARVIVPQFSAADTEEKVSVLIEGLEIMRSHIDLYKAWNDDRLPSTNSLSDFVDAVTKKKGRYNPTISQIPVNPFNGFNTIRFNGEPAGIGRAGWRLDTKTGSFQADNAPGCAAL